MDPSEGVRSYRETARGRTPSAAALGTRHSFARFVDDCRRQSRRLRDDPAEADALEFIERAGTWTDDAPR
jgi:hypothetical protein